ncbi:epimerase [Larkinella ripae]
MKTDKVRAIITGTTGMVGEGVLLECLQNPAVEAVLIINRKPLGRSHPKLTEIIHADFYNFSAIENQLVGYNACYFCLGVSSVGMNEKEYAKVTYTLTMHVAQTLSRLNPDMTFCYVSGAGTDSSENGRQMWARVKGKTENDLTKLPFRRVFNFRPGFMKPTEGMKNTNSYYKYIGWLYPMGRALFPGGFCTLQEVGLAMIHTVSQGYEKPILEVRDIVELAKR